MRAPSFAVGTRRVADPFGFLKGRAFALQILPRLLPKQLEVTLGLPTSQTRLDLGSKIEYVRIPCDE